MKKLCMVGLGYIGLPTAAMFAKNGVDVKGVDINPYVVRTINKGNIHIKEPGLKELVEDVVKKGNLKAYTSIQPADAFIIAVPTPFKENYEPDLKYVKAAVKDIAKVLKKGDLVILESTSPVGTTRKISKWLAEERSDLSFPHQKENSDVKIAYCPERILPGKMIKELEENDRIIGGLNKASSKEAKELYKIFVKGECVETTAEVAEMSKLTENAFRDVNIAFANELSMICDKAGIDVFELIQMANRHPRVNILQPGCGVGGHCIAVDPWFIIHDFPDEAILMKTARLINEKKPLFVIEKVKEALKDVTNPKIAVLGLTYKPDVDDIRESPALEIAKLLSDEGFEILAVEPNIKTLPKVLENRKNVKFLPLNEALSEADLVVILVKHKEFLNLKTDKKVLDFVNAKV